MWNRTKIVEEEHGGYCYDYYGRPIDTPYEEWIDDCNILECPGKKIALFRCIKCNISRDNKTLIS